MSDTVWFVARADTGEYIEKVTLWEEVSDRFIDAEWNVTPIHAVTKERTAIGMARTIGKDLGIECVVVSFKRCVTGESRRSEN